MTDGNYTHIAIVADRSGSMGLGADMTSTRGQAATAGIRQLVQDQMAQPGKLTVSMADFDTQLTEIEDFGDGTKSAGWSCSPRANTALYDAVGTVITRTGERLAAMDEHTRPGKVIVVVATDGEENSSKEYITAQQISDMITVQREQYSWEFVYIGVETDAFAAAARLNIPYLNTIQVAAASTAQSFLTTSSNMSNYRSGAAGSMAYSPKQQDDLSR